MAALAATGGGALAANGFDWRPGGAATVASSSATSPTTASSNVVQAAAAGSVRTVDVPASADTYVVKSRPKINGGSKRWMFATTSENRAFVRFTTAQAVPAGQKVISASLRVYVLNSRVATAGFRVYPLTNSWNEYQVTASNRPAGQSAAVSAAVAVPDRRHWIDVPLAVSAVSTSGQTSLELGHEVSGSSLQLATRESQYQPVLRLQVGSGSAATTTTTTSATKPVTTTKPATSTSSGSDQQQTPGVRPFDLPASGTLASSKRLAFAHYFPPFPVSLDNKAPSSDYYAKEYLTPTGESNKHAAYGGFIRDRPLGRQPLSGDYVGKDLETDIKQARAAGLDGFTVDILSLTSRNWDRTIELLEAAERVDPQFKIMLMPDMTTLNDESAASLATAMKKLAGYPAAFRLADGRLVVSPFKAENHPASWWSDWLNRMKSGGNTVAFVPTFLDWQKHADAFSSISYGFSHWGTANPESAASTARHVEKAHAMGKLWMAPVRVQDVRPNQSIYDEAGNSETLRLSWQGVIDGGAEWVQVPTWNDFSEGSSIAPTEKHGWTYLDIGAYYLAKWKTGQAPAVKRDGLYLIHRTQWTSSDPTYAKQTKIMKVRSGGMAPRDKVEAVVYLTAPATVSVTVGSSTTTWEAPAGMSTKLVSLASGTVSGKVTRGGTVTTDVTSPYKVTSSPYVQNLEYSAVSSLR